jgi:hypothetical protein
LTKVSHARLLDYIPITVIEYDDIRSRQIDAEASSASCEQDELLSARFVVFVNPAYMIAMCGPAISTAIFCANKGTSMML